MWPLLTPWKAGAAHYSWAEMGIPSPQWCSRRCWLIAARSSALGLLWHYPRRAGSWGWGTSLPPGKSRSQGSSLGLCWWVCNNCSFFLWYLAGVEHFCLRVFCFAGLYLSWFGQRDTAFRCCCWVFFFFPYAHWYFQVVSFSSTKIGIYEAKRKPWELTAFHSSGPKVPASLPSSLCLPETSYVCFMYNVHGL